MVNTKCLLTVPRLDWRLFKVLEWNLFLANARSSFLCGAANSGGSENPLRKIISLSTEF